MGRIFDLSLGCYHEDILFLLPTLPVGIMSMTDLPDGVRGGWALHDR